MADDKKYGYCAGKIIKDSGIAEIKYIEFTDKDTGEKIQKPVLKFSIANEHFKNEAGQYTEVNVFGDENELITIEMLLSRWDIVTIANGTLKSGSYEGKNGTVKTMTISTYPNQIVIFDAKKDGQGIKYPKSKIDTEVKVVDGDMPF